ncbi:hypothetical protein I4U23_012794 [Adineta vaga]|nr:hypothetical protein I4U23_012794 [Adineta vaga]
MATILLTNVKLFDKLLDKATSPLLLETDWKSILQLCDVIKTQEVGSKYTIQAIKKKFRHENPHVILNSLQCMESVVKNCGALIHKEIAQKDTMDALKDLAKKSPDQIRDKVLEMIQCWSYGLGSQYKILTDTYDQMKTENYHFPSLKESEAMFQNNDVVPEWRDDKECFRCRQVFTTFVRKHHCRACGNSFCDKCSSKYCSIPKFNIDRDVRVCRLTINEEESLQLALAMSKSDAEEKERQKKKLTEKYAQSMNSSNNPDTPSRELNKYIEDKHKEQQNLPNEIAPKETDHFISDNEIDKFISLVIEHINQFKLRMLSDQQRNRNVSNDTAVQSAFVVLQHLHPELHRFIRLLDDKRAFYENLQDKLTQLKDAREALNALRSEHYERKQQETFERDRQRQILLAQKLDFMRQKKQEYLEYQRQIYLQHLVQQELEMKNRLEQQRQWTLTYNTYTKSAGQILLTNSNVPYIQHYQQEQQIPSMENEYHSEPQLITLN